ncbi:hypothetical protein K0M31_001149 [Melipona bicolor]|uniref:Uncharacterized protein n=1 Tax=Melipona bicolor TaxID=60889 RepID=A0AA40GEZ3_9HYME|nr:hypothetical protein K0M31_001149 [Melipona bicolor]
MYPGRSAWTRGVLALGVGALFLLGWRIDTAGDALSASTPIDSDSNYFSVAVASSRSNSRHNGHGKKEERLSYRLGTEEEDRQAFSRDYSAAEEETRTPRNAKLDGAHEAGYLVEISLPSSDPQRNERSRSYSRETLLPTRGREKNDVESKSSIELWNFEGIDDGSTNLLWDAGKNDDKTDEIGSKNRMMGLKKTTEAEVHYSIDESLPSVGNFENNKERVSYSTEGSFPLWIVEKNGDRTDTGSKSYMAEPGKNTEDEKPLLSLNFDENDLAENEANHVSIDDLAKSSFPSWNLERNDGKNDRSRSYSVARSRLSWNFVRNDQRNDDQKPVSLDSVSSSVPLWDVEKNLEKKYAIKNEHDGGSASYAMEKSFPRLEFERRDHIENNGALTNYSIDKLLSFQDVEGNTKNENKKTGFMYLVENSIKNQNNRRSPRDSSKSWFSLSNLKSNQNSVDHSTKKSLSSHEKSDRSINDHRSTDYSQENVLSSLNSRKVGLGKNKHESTGNSITKKNENYRMENPLQLSDPPFAGKTELVENNRGSRKDPITKKSDFTSLKDPKRRPNDDDEANYTAFRSEAVGSAGEQDETRFSKDDSETGNALNGSAVGERSDVEANLSHRVNGQSMNEVRKSLGRSYNSDTSNSLSLTLREQRGENDDETEEPAKMKIATFSQYSRFSENELSRVKSDVENLTKRQLLSYNLLSNDKNEILFKSINNRDLRHRNDGSVSMEPEFDRRIEGKVNVESLKKIFDDFHNSDQLSDFEEVEKYKRDEELISGTQPVFVGMLFFRKDHGPIRSSAKTFEQFRSGKGRATDRRNILERRTRSRDRSPRTIDPSVDFRKIDTVQGHVETFGGFEITDSRNRLDTSARETDSASSLLRENEKLFDEEITKVVPTMIDELNEIQKSKNTFDELNLYDRFADIRKDRRKLELRGEILLDTNNVQQLENQETNKNILKLSVFVSEAQTFKNRKVNKKLNSRDEFWNVRKFWSKVDSGNERSHNFLKRRKFGNDEMYQNFKIKLQSVKLPDSSLMMRNLKDRSKKLNLRNRFLNKSKDQDLFLSFFRKADVDREKQSGIRRKRYTNYYSPQSVTPMAYVHIQPAYPVPAVPPSNRKCVKCMVVYNPCASSPRQSQFNVLPTYKYQESASKWRGLKYGE